MKANGLIVVENTESWYKGVDRYPWPLKQYDPILHRMLFQMHQVSWDCDMIQDLEFALHYQTVANKHAQGAEVLYGEFMDVRLPTYSIDLFEKITGRCEFIGWDYSYAGGDFYSCVDNDLSLKKDLFYNLLNYVNQNGLFETEADVNTFIKLRKKLRRKYPVESFEIGPFYKAKLFRVW